MYRTDKAKKIATTTLMITELQQDGEKCNTIQQTNPEKNLIPKGQKMSVMMLEHGFINASTPYIFYPKTRIALDNENGLRRGVDRVSFEKS